MKNYLLSVSAFLLIPIFFSLQAATSTNDVKLKQRDDVYCPDVYDPVCGSDGKTYSNGCYASVAGVTYTRGACGGGSEY